MRKKARKIVKKRIPWLSLVFLLSMIIYVLAFGAKTVNFIKNIWLEQTVLAVDDITFGSEYIFNNASTAYTDVDFLTNTRFVVAYQDTSDSSDGTAIIGNIDGNNVTYGPEYKFNTGTDLDITVLSIDSARFLTVYRFSTGAIYARIGTVSGTSTIAWGAEGTLHGTSYYSLPPVSLAASLLSPTQFAIVYREGTIAPAVNLIAKVCTFSGTTISGCGVEYAHGIMEYTSSVASLDSTHFAIAYEQRTFGAGKTVIGVVSGDTVSYGSESANYEGHNLAYTSVSTLDSTHFVISYSDSVDYIGKSVICSVSGGTNVTCGSSYIFNNAQTRYVDVNVFETNKFGAVYRDTTNSSYGTLILGTVSGTSTIAYGAENIFNPASTAYTSVSFYDPSLFAIAYQDTGNSSKGTIVLGTLNASPVISVTPTSRDFGSVLVGSSTTSPFTITNSGAGTLTGAVSGLDAPFYCDSGCFYNNLAAGASQQAIIRFTPTGAGSFSDTAVFSSGGGASNGVSGIGTINPTISVTPALLDFGSVDVGSYKDLSFTVTNTGGGILSGSSSVLALPFSYVGNNSYNLASGSSTDIVIRFTPIAGGSLNSTVNFSGGGGANRNISGTGNLTGQIVVTPDPLDFGDILVNSSSTMDFIISNEGAGILSGTTTILNPPSSFSCISGCSYNIFPGATSTVSIKFYPRAEGSFSDTVSFTGGGGTTRTVIGSGVSVMTCQNDDNVWGWAWSDGLGWVSFSCVNEDDPDSSPDYGVNIDDSDPLASEYDLSGYARTEYTGWITFNEFELTGCPAGICKAWVEKDTAKLYGWARACSVFQNGCSGSLKPNDQRGDWDGWIRFDGQTTSGQDIDSHVQNGTPSEFYGWMWGGNVVGWVSLNHITEGNPNSNYAVYTDIELDSPPQVINMLDPDGKEEYCNVSPGQGSVNFQWDYQDDKGLESKFDFKVDNSASGNSPEISRSVNPVCFDTDPGQGVICTNTQQALVGSDLDFNTTYYWWVRVYDNNNLDSGWIIGPSFTTASNAYPWVDFYSDPAVPPINEITTFYSSSTYSGSPSYEWTFQGGVPAISFQESPTTTFTTSGDKTVTFKLTDSVGSCSITKVSSPTLPLPDWIEIPPE